MVIHATYLAIDAHAIFHHPQNCSTGHNARLAKTSVFAIFSRGVIRRMAIHLITPLDLFKIIIIIETIVAEVVVRHCRSIVANFTGRFQQF